MAISRISRNAGDRDWFVASPPMMSFAETGRGFYQQRGGGPTGVPMSQPANNAGHQQKSLWGNRAPIVTTQNFRVRQKPNSRLAVFDGNMLNYKIWRSRVKDHLCNRSTRRYESLLESIENSSNPITKTSLLISTVDGVNAREVAEELEGLIFDYVCRRRSSCQHRWSQTDH